MDSRLCSETWQKENKQNDPEHHLKNVSRLKHNQGNSNQILWGLS